MKIWYRLFLLVSRCISKLPFPLLYFLSDVFSFLLYHVVRYRRKVVYKNLLRSFPEKSKKQRYLIAHRFYRHLADLVLEVLKIKRMSIEDFRRRIHLKNIDLLEPYFENGKSVIVATGHLGNWEWLGVFLSTYPKCRCFAVVKPLSDKFFENYLTSLRLKFNHEGLIDFRKTLREMIKLKDSVCMTLFAADQTPTKDEINYWTRFLNQDTAVFLGIEKIAKSLDQPVFFMNMFSERRGYYEVEFTLLSDQPQSTAESELTEMHVRHLEEVIKERPHNWLWSHRRWKHKKNE